VIFNWRGRTRAYLAADEHVKQMESILHSLSGWLGQQLFVDDEASPNGILDLPEPGALRHWIDVKLARSEENSKQLRTLINDEIPYPRALGSIHFVSKDGMKNVHLHFDQFRLAPVLDELRFGNILSIESEDSSTSGNQLAEIALSVMTTLFDNDLFDHGFCCASGEYNESNLDRDGGGVRAVGLDASKWLPGFYWANYFGSHLCELVGRDVLMTTPGCRRIQLGSGVLVANTLPPDRWSDAEFIENSQSAMSHIGRHLFFEKGKAAGGSLFT